MRGADDDAGRFEAHIDAVRAVIAFSGSVRLRVDIKSVVGAGLHAGFTTDAAAVVKVDDAILSPVQCRDWTNLDAGCVVTVIAAHHRKEPSRIRELTLFDVLDPSSIDAHWDVVFRLTCNRAGMTADTAAIVDNESKVGQVDDACERGKKSNRSRPRITAPLDNII